MKNDRSASRARNGETEAHFRLKRLALIWAQQSGYSACALEVSLPRSRYRADVAAYRPAPGAVVTAEPPVRSAGRTDSADGELRLGTTAVFECKQCLVDLRRDNGCAATTTRRLEKVHARREVLERNLRVHYPALCVHDSLFAEFDSHNFEAIDHRGYKQVLRQTRALQNRLFDCTKFETLVRYRCANLFFLVLPKEWSDRGERHGRSRRKGTRSSVAGAAEIQLFRGSEIPVGWGALVESNGALDLVRKPTWHEVATEHNLRLFQRIAAAGTRSLNRQLGVTFERLGSTK